MARSMKLQIASRTAALSSMTSIQGVWGVGMAEETTSAYSLRQYKFSMFFEITYIAPDRKLMSVAFDVEKKSVSTPRVLFQTRIIGPTFVSTQYDVAPDGRFVINSLVSNNASPLTMLDKWTAELKKK